MSKPSIEVRDLAKIYRIYGNPYNRLRELLPWNRGRKLHREVAALRDITFAVEPGQCVGMIGKNGAGKSTLLKVLTGTTFPTHGSYTVRGRVSSLLELGAGFHADFTGRENIYMNAAMMGFSRREAQRKFAEIVEFSGLGDFIDAPIRTYSSGMICRLGFSVAVATDPDVLIIDEILAVGDLEFQRRCVDKIWDYKKRGKTMFFCSHSLYDVRQICERAIWLRNGRIHQLGDAVGVTNDYAAFENQTRDVPDELPMDQLPAAPGVDPVQPDDRDLQQPRIVDAVLIDPATGAERNEFSTGDAVGVRVVVRNGREPVPLVVGVGAMRKDGTLCFAHSSEWGGQRLVDSEFEITLTLPQVRLLSGEFNVPVWLLDENGVHRYHQRPARQQLIVRNRTKDLGLFLQEHHWQVRAVQRKD